MTESLLIVCDLPNVIVSDQSYTPVATALNCRSDFHCEHIFSDLMFTGISYNVILIRVFYSKHLRIYSTSYDRFSRMTVLLAIANSSENHPPWFGYSLPISRSDISFWSRCYMIRLNAEPKRIDKIKIDNQEDSAVRIPRISGLFKQWCQLRYPDENK